MGVACPQLSDEPSYTMVDSSGSSCRCACQDELFQDPSQDQPPSGCCSPHVFTSILLGILSCVLMTGGVFLAFHRWDPMWLMVSGIGVILIIIGSILHCCNSMSQRPKRHSTAGKGCCSTRPLPPEHSGHMIANSGSLTEQLLPLSNARSVSQLSLNMLPGYFPPVVTAYGIEQHSAVVQNINRLVQQQQQQQQQQATPAQQNPGSISPAVISNAGKSFIVLSLPGDATAANIQNLVATVYQLDGNTTESTTNEVIPNITSPIITVKPNSSAPLILKSVEVQTCNVWPAPTSTTATSTSGECSSCLPSTSGNSVQTTPQPTDSPQNIGATQTDDSLPAPAENSNLIDCSTDISTPLCDINSNTCDNQPVDNNSVLVDIPPSSSADLLEVSLAVANAECASASVLVDIPEQSAENIAGPSHCLIDRVVGDASPSNVPTDCVEVLVDISEDEVNSSDMNPLLENLVNSNLQQMETIPEGGAAVASSSRDDLLALPPENSNASNLQSLNPELLSSTGNLSTADTDIDDGELMERSSPPPSYEDVTLEGESVGAFSLAYGTI